jgi:hypothetical protein
MGQNELFARMYGARFDIMPPNLVTFFTPTEQFLEWLAEYVGDQFVIEVGAGQCHFTQAMHRYKIKAMAIEARPSDETRLRCANFLWPKPVEESEIVLNKKSVVIAARPDHSGWFELLPSLIHHESELIYIGLERNLDRDIPDHWSLDILYSDAGEEGEHMWRVHS